MRKISLLFALVASLFATEAFADFTGKDASLATITFKNPNTCSSVVCVPIFSLFDPTGTNGAAIPTAGADAQSNTANGLLTYSRNVLWNGTTWDRWMGDLTNGGWVNVKSSVLPPGAATSAAQTTAQTSLSSIDTKTPALGQALAAASVPVILPAATITTLTPPTTVTANLGTLNGAATAANQGTTADAPCTLPATTTACTQIAVEKAIANAANAAATFSSQYPSGATPLTASATGTTAATTATLAGTTGKTTYICSLSVRANATANTNVTDTVTGVITGTLSRALWVPANTAGLGVDEQIYNPCVPASATNTAIAVVSGAPGTGGVVTVNASGYQQ